MSVPFSGDGVSQSYLLSTIATSESRFDSIISSLERHIQDLNNQQNANYRDLDLLVFSILGPSILSTDSKYVFKRVPSSISYITNHMQGQTDITPIPSSTYLNGNQFEAMLSPVPGSHILALD